MTRWTRPSALVRVVAQGHHDHAQVRARVAADPREGVALGVAGLQAELQVAHLALVVLPPGTEHALLDALRVRDAIGGTRARGRDRAPAIVVQGASIAVANRAGRIGVGRRVRSLDASE